MADMDLDELLDGPSKGPIRPSRYAPKGIKPKPKTEPSPGSVPEYANDTVEMDLEVKPEENVKSEVKKQETDDFMETEERREDVAEAEDRIVRDVYFAPSFDPNTRLYVLQYPLRPLWRPYELEERCEEVRVKPASSELEVDLTVDINSKNYDSCADPRLHTKKQTLSSSWKPPPTNGLALGVLTENKLYLNPIHAVVQLRPSMQHLDEGSKRKNVMSSNLEEMIKAEKSEGEPLAVSKKLSKPSMQKRDSGEGWVPLKYHGSKSDLAARYLNKMMAEEGSPIYFSMSAHDYLDSLCGTLNDRSISKGPPRRSLMTLPLKERFKTWLVNGPPIHRFDALKHLAPEESVEEVLEVLQEHARLVQGLWIPKTLLVKQRDPGINEFARDYVLLLLSKNALIKNSEIPQQQKHAEEMKKVLNVLAVERPAFNDWKLKELPDMSFIKQNPSVVKKQEEEWECLENKINKHYGGRNRPGTKTSSKSSNTINNQVTSKSSNKVATRISNKAAPRSAMSEEAREDIKKALQELFKSIKVCSYQQISQRLRDMAVLKRSTTFAREAVAAAECIDTFPDELQAIVSQVAVNVHGICVPKSSPNHPQYDLFRKVVIDLFVAEGPNAKLKKAPIIEAAKMELKREIPQIEYQKVLQELCVSQGSLWSLRSDENAKL
ncbi:hypothetical protein ACJIZ3_002251 [Penstemon smallii]|uniref:DNA-directed RNA polymerase III subunit RPC5 n=1 Tax=Penstemon smallii TaxID=265156 RepID=A0ABD3U9M2_9LAMI